MIVIELILNIAGFSMSNWVTLYVSHTQSGHLRPHPRTRLYTHLYHANTSDSGFSYVPGPVAWRVPLAIQFIFIFILYATVPWLPESPRWLVSKGRYDEAEQILADVEGTEVEDPYVQTELGEIKFASQYEKEHAVRIRDLVRGRVSENDPCTLRRILLGMGMSALTNVSLDCMNMLTPLSRRSSNAAIERHQRKSNMPLYSP